MNTRRKLKMSKRETEFFIYCTERYRYYKALSGAETAEIFEKYDVYSYVNRYFKALHTMGDVLIVQDIDEYIRSC